MSITDVMVNPGPLNPFEWVVFILGVVVVVCAFFRLVFGGDK